MHTHGRNGSTSSSIITVTNLLSNNSQFPVTATPHPGRLVELDPEERSERLEGPTEVKVLDDFLVRYNILVQSTQGEDAA